MCENVQGYVCTVISFGTMNIYIYIYISEISENERQLRGFEQEPLKRHIL
jgi:hypothetical protein